MSDSVRTHRRPPTRLPRPWDSPGKNTGVGCHFLLQGRKLKSESEVESEAAQSTLSNPLDCSPPGSWVHGIFQARVLEWGTGSLKTCFLPPSPPLPVLYTPHSSRRDLVSMSVPPRSGQSCHGMNSQSPFTLALGPHFLPQPHAVPCTH